MKKLPKILEKYFDKANQNTEIGEHLFILNALLSEIVKNTAPSKLTINNNKI